MPDPTPKQIIDQARAEGIELYFLPGEYQLKSRPIDPNDPNARKMPTMSARLASNVNNYRDEIMEYLGSPKPPTRG
jgi:hypothetical protein